MSTEIVSQKYNRFPDSDGQPIADNTLQLEWIETLHINIKWIYIEDPDVFVAGDNLIYPDATDDRICMAPDVYVAYGRPKHHRGSYKLWNEANIFPQVIVEVLSPRNSKKEMKRKRDWYEAHGCEEYLELNPKTETLSVWVRSPQSGQLVQNRLSPDWTSPRLKTRFIQLSNKLQIEFPDGKPFRSSDEIHQAEENAQQRAEAEKQRADSAEARADAEQLRREQLAAKLRELGIDPDSI